MKKLVYSLCAVALTVAVGGCLAGCSSSTSSDNANANANVTTNTASANTNANTTSAVETTVADNYVDAAWLSKNLDNVIVIDCRSADEYAAGHVPGAINLSYKQASATSKGGGPLAYLLASYGINGDKDIVCYTNISIFFGEDGCMDWTLAEAGIPNCKILDGGWAAWTAANGATSTETTTLSKVDQASGIDLSPVGFVTGKYVYDNLDKATIVDVRETAEYNGETNYGEKQLGRIKGAVSLPISSLYNADYTVKSADELEALYKAAGLTDKNAEIITYCTGGIRASDVAMILSESGFTNVSVYGGSFSEWAANSSYPVETGAAK